MWPAPQRSSCASYRFWSRILPLMTLGLCACSIILEPRESGSFTLEDAGADTGGDEAGHPDADGDVDEPTTRDSSPDDADVDVDADADPDIEIDADEDSGSDPVPEVIAWDGFESGRVDGGEGWNQEWHLDGDYDITSGGPPTAEGAWHLIIWGDGYGDRTVDLSGFTDAKLAFSARGENLSGSDSIDVRYIPHDNGRDDYHCCLLVLNAATLSRDYRRYEIELHSSAGASNYGIAFQAEMPNTSARVYLDQVEVYGIR